MRWVDYERLHVKSVMRIRDCRMGHHPLIALMISIVADSKNYGTRGMGHDDLMVHILVGNPKCLSYAYNQSVDFG